MVFLAWALLLGGAATASGQGITVGPPALYLDSRTPTAVVTLFNPGTEPVEASVEFAFGYPVSDREGNVSVPLTPGPTRGERSAVDWLRAFPRQVVLEPGQRQAVRVVVTPPAELPDGEYWARMVVDARGGQPTPTDTVGDVSLAVSVRTRNVLAVNYRSGIVETGVRVVSAAAARDADGVTFEVDLERTGNAAYLGRLRADVLDGTGALVASVLDDIAVYRVMRRRLVVPVPDTAEGSLEVRMTITAERQDLPVGGALPATPVTVHIPVATP